MNIAVRGGVYLRDNKPASSQYRAGRRSPVKSVIVVHTAQSGTDKAGADQKAENVAEFIRGRSDAGSYQLIGDADSIIQLIRFEDEAFHDGTGSNRWSIGISLAMNAGDWAPGVLSDERRSQLLDTAAFMAYMAAEWLGTQGKPAPVPTTLTRAQSERPDASGFISHARRDPERRTDPGDHFPWVDFLARYAELLHIRPRINKTGTTNMADQHIIEWQKAIGVEPDGDFGPRTLAASQAVVSRGDRCFESLAAYQQNLSEAYGEVEALKAQIADAGMPDELDAETEAKAVNWDKLSGLMTDLIQP